MSAQVSNKILGAIGIVIITVVLLALTPTIVDTVQAVNSDSWTFTGHQGAEDMLGLVPFVWVAGVLISATVGMIVLARGAGEGKKRGR